MSLNKKLIPDLLLVGINQVIDRTTAATTFVLQGVRAIFDPSNPQNTELYYRDDAGGEHYFPSSEKLADPSAGDDIGVNAAGVTASKLNPALAELKSTSGDPSLGAQNDFNVADGSGGWIPLSTANGPRFYKDPVTNEVAYEFHIRASYFNATLGIDLKKDNGQFRFKNDAGTTTHALITTAVDSLGPGLHELLIMLCEQVNINAKVLIGQDLRVSGDLFLSGLIDSGTNTNKEMMVWDNTTATVERRPIPASGSSSVGAAGIINIADGAGGWLAMDGSARPLLEYSSTTGNLSYTGGNFLVSETIQATDKFDIAYDGGQLRFRDTTNTITLGRMYVVKDSLGVGQHQMVLADAKRITIPFELNSIDAVFFPNIFNPGTDVGKHMVITDDVTGKVEKRPMPSGGLPSDFIICRSSADVLAALALAQDYKTIFLYAGAEIVNPSAINTPIDVYGQNVILGSISLVTISTLIPTNTLQFQRTGAGFTSIRVSGLALSLFPGIIGGANVVNLDNVTIIADNLSTPPSGYTVNGAGGALYWKFLQDLAIPTAGTAIARQAFTNTWGMTNTFSVANETDFIKYLQMDLPVKILNIVTDTIALSSSTITGVTGRIEIYGTNLSISIPSSGTLSIEAASTPIKEISFFVSRLNLINVTTLNLENVSFRARTLVNSPPGTTNVTSTATGTGSLSYENPDLTGAIVFTGLATQTFWDNTLVDAFGKLPAVDGSQLTNLPSSGSPSVGTAGIINIADGSGGWLPMDGSARPLLEWSSTTGNLVFSGGNDLFSDNIKASLTLNITDNSGELRFRDSNDTINLARFQIARDSLGTGLHELYLYDCKRLTIPNDLKVAGDITFDNLVDPATDTGKKMLVIDTTTKEIEERPIPTGVGGSDTKVLVQGQMDTTQSFSTAAERIDYVDSTLDVNNEWDNTTHRFTCGASGAGVYQFTNTLFVDNAAGWVQIFCKKNGVTQRITATDLHSSWDAPAGTTNIELVVGDYVEFWADSTTSFSVNAAWYALNNFQITKISAVAPTAGVDVNAVHTNIANEITPLTAKAIASVNDVVLIEDSADSNNKKKVTIGTLRNGVESFTNPSSLSPDASLITQINANSQAQALTINVPTNPFDGAKIIFRIRATTTSTLSWVNGATDFNDIKSILPFTAPLNKIIYVGVIYNDPLGVWDVVSVVEQS